MKYLFQLLLSPRHGWEDISAESPDPEVMLRKGFYPLLVFTSLMEVIKFFAIIRPSAWYVVSHIVLDFGAYFMALYVARYVLDLYLGLVSEPGTEVNQKKVSTFIVMGMGLMVVMQLISNCLPGTLLFLRFLPLYVVLVIYKAVPYMAVVRGAELRFLGLAATAIVAVPLFIYYFLDLLI